MTEVKAWIRLDHIETWGDVFPAVEINSLFPGYPWIGCDRMQS